MTRLRDFFQPRSARFWLVVFAITTALGLLSFGYRYTDVFVRGGVEPIHDKLIEELTGWYGALVVVPMIAWVTLRLRSKPIGVALTLHAGAVIATSVVHTSWNWGTRVGAYAALGYEPYDYGIMRLRYLMELPNDVIWYVVTAIIVLLLEHYRTARDREMHLVQVESELSRLRLQSLEAQLQPHFLFNALNTVSSVMYEDVAAADAILTRLGDLLRRTLRRQGVAEVSLAEEVETLELYCEILRARFADRLDVRIDIAADATDAAVPQLVLQPLVENAVKHGDPGPGRTARISVRAHRNNGALHLEVEDNGPGLAQPTDAESGGVGLTNTRRRLEQLYGGNHSLSLGAGADGGLRVAISIPFRAAEPVPRDA